jgi:nickel transport protein
MVSATSLRLAMLAPLLLLTTAPAEAHALKVFAAAAGDRIEGRVYFAGGHAARGATVQVETTDGRRLAITTADADGRFIIDVRERIDHVIIADSGDGHVARFTVAAATLPVAMVPLAVPESLPPAAPGAAPATAAPATATAASIPPSAAAAGGPAGLEDIIARSVAAQIAPLREQIDAHEDRLRVRDVLGGLGYILGLAGLAAWLWARRRGEAGR